MTMRLAPQVHEHVVAVQIPVLAVQVIGIQPDQIGADRDGPRPARLRPGTVVVRPGHDLDLPFRDHPILVPQSEGLTNPQARAVKNGEQQAIPQPITAVKDRLNLANGEDPRMLPRGPSSE